KELDINQNQVSIKITSEITKELQPGTNQIKIFTVSNSVLKPDIFETNFLITKEKVELPKTEINVKNVKTGMNYYIWIILLTIIVLVMGIAIYVKKKF
ncbi:MAG: ABC transporter substrate-binding protein, partial [Candidatus Nitrosopelagicus sp.]|nr:ABC transporter substrate-binding protein [Candidatus Nitrosopelagicus sp.]